MCEGRERRCIGGREREGGRESGAKLLFEH